MRLGLRGWVGGLIAGVLIGILAAVAVLLTPLPLDPLIWLVATTIGAAGGACYAVWFILQIRTADDGDGSTAGAR